MVAKQAVPARPGKNRWTHRVNGLPFSTLPSGTNRANYNVSVAARGDGTWGAGAAGDQAVRLCGRVGLFQPSSMGGKGSHSWPDLQRCSVGTCLSVYGNGSWEVTEVATKGGAPVADAKGVSCHVLASGDLVQPPASWVRMGLSFEGGSATPTVEGRPLAGPLTTSLLSGVAAVGSNWHEAHS